MNYAKMIGVLAGMLFALLAVYIVGKLLKRKYPDAMSKDFDERQVAARGNAYKYAFITMLILNATQIALSTIFEKDLFEATTWGAITLSIGIAVFACVSIWSNAYASYKDSENGKISMICLGILGLFNIGIGIYELCTEIVIVKVVDGQITGIPVNLLIGSTLIVVTFVMLIKRIRDKSGTEE